MAQKKVGELIKEARTAKGLSQAKLAGMIDGLSATDLGKAERGQKDLTQAQLKAIAKATGVTQKSLLEAAAGTAAAGKTAAKTTAKKTTASTAKKTSSSTTTAIKLTAAEKRVLELYRVADAATKKNAEAVLKGTKQVQEDSGGNPLMEGLLGGALDILSGPGKREMPETREIPETPEET